MIDERASMGWKPRISNFEKPKYLAFVDALEADIASGTLRHGDRLPPQRDIAQALDVTIATVTKAFREALQRGIVTSRTGSGTFVRVGDGSAEFERPQMDLSLNTVPSRPSKPFLDAALEEMGARHASDTLCAYEPATGSEAHRTVMAKWLRKRQLSVAPSDVLLTHGAQHALAACFYALAHRGDTVLCEQWTYAGIRRLGDLNQVKIEAVAMDEQGLDPADLARKLKKTGAKVVICTASVQNPTTATMSAERRRKIVTVCRDNEAIIVEDDIYGMLSGDPLPPLAALDREVVIHVSSLSKCIAPGIRLGTVVASDRHLATLQNALIALQWTAPSFWVEMFGFMMESGSADRCVAANQKEAARRLGIFREVTGLKPSTTMASYHIWQAVPDSWRLDDFISELLTLGVRVSPGHHFSVDRQTNRHNDFIRICLGGGDSTELLKEQLTKFRAVIGARPRLSTTIT
jgi:DNA-binding transcriptional MocR family regulator